MFCRGGGGEGSFVEAAPPRPGGAPGPSSESGGAGRRSGPLCPARRPTPAEPDAALPPRSAPRSEHAARCECSVSETPRAAADGDAAIPRKTAHTFAARAKERAALNEMLRPAHPHRTRHCRFFCVRPGTRTLARGISDTFHDEEKCPF